MVPGELYLGWVCKNKSCGLVIAIALTQAGSKPASAEFDDQLAAIKCPHCGDEDLYRWSARSEHKYTVGSAGTLTPACGRRDPRISPHLTKRASLQ